MTVTMVRQKILSNHVEEADAAVRDLFATFKRVGLDGVRYASTRVADTSTFVILFELADGIEDPRPTIAAYSRFLQQLQGWVDGPPVIEQLDVIGTYQLFAPLRDEEPPDTRVPLATGGGRRPGSSPTGAIP